MDFFFRPKSIVVIGASLNPQKLGHQVLKNIIEGGFKGKLYACNIDPSVKKVLGVKNYPSVLDIPESPDLAIFVIPAQAVPSVLEECGKKKIKGAIIISAGFKEIGPEGEKLENELIKISKFYSIRILGPNCLGLIDSISRLNASFAPSFPKKGNIAVISQSGAVCTAILDWAQVAEVGFSRFISLGNKADVTEIDLLEFLEKDKATELIIAYLESIGNKVDDGRKFIEIAKKLSLKKPLIVVKAGKTEKGAKAIATHTGALAGSQKAIDAAFLKSGVIKADSLEELFVLAKSFSKIPLPEKKEVLVITNAGGPGVMATDALEAANLPLAKLEKGNLEILRKNLPKAASLKNPVDLIGDAKADRYELALKVGLKDKNTGAILLILTPQTATEIEKTAEVISEKLKTKNEKRKAKNEKPIFPIFIGGEKVKKGIRILEKAGIPVFGFPEKAVNVLKKFIEYRNWKEKIKKAPQPVSIEIEKYGKENVAAWIKEERLKNVFHLGDQIADEILRTYKIPVLKSRLVQSATEAIAASRELTFPVVLKISSPDIIHKSDVGGVKVDLKNEEEVKRAFNEIIKNVKRKKPKARINGIVVYPMAKKGIEFVIGVKRDPLFGPLIMFGFGGIWIEVFKDVSFRLAPLTPEDAKEMISEIKAYKLIKGVRGQPPLDEKAIIDTILKVCKLIQDQPEIEELDINPLLVYEKGVLALDNRILIKK